MEPQRVQFLGEAVITWSLFRMDCEQDDVTRCPGALALGETIMSRRVAGAPDSHSWTGQEHHRPGHVDCRVSDSVSKHLVHSISTLQRHQTAY